MLTADRSSDYKHYSGDAGKVARVDLYYRKGKGIYVSIQEVELKHEDGFTSESFTLFQNRRVSVMLLQLTRGNPSKLRKIAAALNPKLDEVIAAWQAGNATPAVLLPFVTALQEVAA